MMPQPDSTQRWAEALCLPANFMRCDCRAELLTAKAPYGTTVPCQHHAGIGVCIVANDAGSVGHEVAAPDNDRVGSGGIDV